MCAVSHAKPPWDAHKSRKLRIEYRLWCSKIGVPRRELHARAESVWLGIGTTLIGLAALFRHRAPVRAAIAAAFSRRV